MAAAAAPRRRLTTRERRGVVRHRDGSVPPEAGHFFLSDSDIDGDGREWGAWVSASATHHAIGAGRCEARGWRSAYKKKNSVSQSWKVTGHFFRLYLRPRCPGNGTIGEFSRENGAPGRIRTCDPRLRRPGV